MTDFFTKLKTKAQNIYDKVDTKIDNALNRADALKDKVATELRDAISGNNQEENSDTFVSMETPTAKLSKALSLTQSEARNLIELISNNTASAYDNNDKYVDIILEIADILKSKNSGKIDFNILKNAVSGFGQVIDELKIDLTKDEHKALVVDTLSAMLDDDIEINSDNSCQQLKKYYELISSDGGFKTVEEYRKKNNNNNDSISKRLKAFDKENENKTFTITLQDGSTETFTWNIVSEGNTDEQLELKILWYLTEYYNGRKSSGLAKINHFFNRVVKATGENFNESEEKRFDQDISKLFTNTTSTYEKDLLYKCLVTAGYYEDAESAKSAVERIINFSNSSSEAAATSDELKDEETTTSVAGDLGEEQGAKYADMNYGSSTSEQRKEYNSDVEKREALLRSAKEKLKKDPNAQLSEEELEVLKNERIYKYTNPAITAAAADEGDEESLNELNGTFKEHRTPEEYEEILKDLYGYLQKKGHETKSSQVDISKILDKVTDNKYSEVTRELGNNNDTEIAENNYQASIGFAQKENVNNNTNSNVHDNNTETASTASIIDTPIGTENTSKNTISYGFSATGHSVDTTKLDLVNQTITAQTTEAVRAENQGEEEVVVTKTTSFIKALSLGKEGVKQFFAENGTIKAVKSVFNNFSQILDKSVIARAIQLYKGLSSSEQADILVTTKNSALNELINNSDTSALAQCQGETASNVWATKKINKAAEKALEKQA